MSLGTIISGTERPNSAKKKGRVKMGKVKNKLIDWKDRLKDRHMLSIIVVLIAMMIAMGVWIYKKQ